MTVTERLFELQDKEYAAFHSKLIPTIDTGLVIGVRVPAARKLAKQLIKEKNYEEFLHSLPHRYYDENLLHGLLIAEMKDYEACIHELDRFLPYVDNWAVCDYMSPKVLGKNKDALLEKIKEWIASEHAYTCRFGMEMLMVWFLDEDFRPELLELPASVRSDEYYVNMMIAWFFATALAKQWDAALPYITGGRLEPWTHNKTIQKAKESYRITKEQKDYLSRSVINVSLITKAVPTTMITNAT